MKKIILPIVFAVASMPLTFAAQAPANPPASGTQTKSSTDTTAKKHKKSGKKSTPKKSTGSTAAPSK